MSTSSQQAYFDDDAVLASSRDLDPERVRAALPGGDGLRVSMVEGVGLVVARRAGDFAHAVVGANGAYPIELALLDEPSDELEEVAAHPVDLAFLAEAPAGVATRLLDAALAGPVVFSEPDEERRPGWIAWLCYALPGGASLSFSTAGDADARVRVADEPGAIDTTEPCDLTPTFYARVALELAVRGELRAAVAELHEPDGLALAVHGGATELLAPHQLPLALQLITELATSGRVREAARAAAGLPAGGPSTALVVHEELPAPELVAPEPAAEEEIPEAVVVPFELMPADDPEPDEALPDIDAWSSLLAELKSESVEPDESLPVLPEPEPDPPATASFDLGLSLEAFAASLRDAPPSQDDEVVVEQEVGMSLAELEESLKREEER